MQFTLEVLPAPFGPMIENSSPAQTAKLTSLKAFTPRNPTVTWHASRTGAGTAASGIVATARPFLARTLFSKRRCFARSIVGRSGPRRIPGQDSRLRLGHRAHRQVRHGGCRSRGEAQRASLGDNGS